MLSRRDIVASVSNRAEFRRVVMVKNILRLRRSAALFTVNGVSAPRSLPRFGCGSRHVILAGGWAGANFNTAESVMTERYDHSNALRLPASAAVGALAGSGNAAGLRRRDSCGSGSRPTRVARIRVRAATHERIGGAARASAYAQASA